MSAILYSGGRRKGVEEWWLTVFYDDLIISVAFLITNTVFLMRGIATALCKLLIP